MSKPVTEKQKEYAKSLKWLSKDDIPDFTGNTYEEFIEYCDKYEPTIDRRKAKFGIY